MIGRFAHGFRAGGGGGESNDSFRIMRWCAPSSYPLGRWGSIFMGPITPYVEATAEPPVPQPRKGWDT